MGVEEVTQRAPLRELLDQREDLAERRSVEPDGGHAGDPLNEEDGHDIDRGGSQRPQSARRAAPTLAPKNSAGTSKNRSALAMKKCSL